MLLLQNYKLSRCCSCFCSCCVVFIDLSGLETLWSLCHYNNIRIGNVLYLLLQLMFLLLLFHLLLLL